MANDSPPEKTSTTAGTEVDEEGWRTSKAKLQLKDKDKTPNYVSSIYGPIRVPLKNSEVLSNYNSLIYVPLKKTVVSGQPGSNYNSLIYGPIMVP